MKIGLQLYTLRNFMQDEKSINETFRKVKEMGYDIVQVSGIGLITEEKARFIKIASEKYKLEIGATHISFDQLKDQFDWIVEVHKLWNCRYIGIGMMPNEYQQSIEGYQAFIELMNTYGERLEKENCHLLYHHHAFEFRKFSEGLGLDILFSRFNPSVQMEIDTFWIQKGGQSPVTWIKKVSGRMDVVHFKDMGINGWDNQIMECIGTGNLDWDEIIEICQKTNVKYAFVEQDDCQNRDPFLCVKKSLDYLRYKGL